MSNHSKKGKFKCDDCEKSFNEEWKLNAHKKSHAVHYCDHCEKSFNGGVS